MGEQLEPGQNDILQDEMIINYELKQDLTENPEDSKIMRENDAKYFENRLSELYREASSTRDIEIRRRIIAEAKEVEERFDYIMGTTVTKEEYERGRIPHGYKSDSKIKAKTEPITYRSIEDNDKVILARGHNTLENDKRELEN